MLAHPRTILTALAALTGLALPTAALDLEAPESVTGPLVPISAWEIGPLLKPDPKPIPSAWSAWHQTPKAPAPSLLPATRDLLLDWTLVLSDAAIDLRDTAETIASISRPMLSAIAPPPTDTQPTVPRTITLILAGANLLESLGTISLEPHADLAWAEIPQHVEQPYRLITFLGEGEKPHGTLDFAGHAPSTETIPAE